MYRKLIFIGIIVSLLACGTATKKNQIALISNHDVAVVLDPANHSIKGTDKITVNLTPHRGVVGFLLNKSFSKVELINSPGFDLLKKNVTDFSKHSGEELDSAEVNLYNYFVVEIEQPDSVISFTLTYEGTIYDSLQSKGEYARSFAQTSGLIDEKGVFLFGATGWVPTQKTGSFTFHLKTHFPLGWQSISQGEETMRGADGEFQINKWTCDKPMEEIYLIGGRYVITEEDHHGIKVMTYTFAEEPELTQRYRQATKRYIDMYSEQIGPYAFKKFALVENFWQTGYGMPSFTLLGSQVIRLPFIIHTSYGHEILHNWWGNGVYVDWERGNWCEGITNYMADHYYKQLRGQDAAYRRAMLQNYLNYVQDGRDFPLTEFTERHNPATQAVGYSKSAMVFHILNKMLGREKFLTAVRSFYKNYCFKAASWADVEKEFSQQYGEDLSWFFDQWINRIGAPNLKLENVEVAAQAENYEIKVTLKQQQPIYRMLVPIQFVGEIDTTINVTMDTQKETFSINLPEKPDKVLVDPKFDVFRKLDRKEIPAALAQTLGAKQSLIILPGSAEKEVYEAYQKLAEKLSSSESIEMKSDKDVDEQDFQSKAVWIFGTKNKYFPNFCNALPQNVSFEKDKWQIYDNQFPSAGHAVVLNIKHPDDPEFSWTFINVDNIQDLPSLSRKLPHYGKYSYLIFEGTRNVSKGEWDVEDSPLVWKVD